MRIAAVALLLLFPAETSLAQSESAGTVLRGRVTAASDNFPLQRAKLVVTVNNREYAATRADEAGGFELPVPSRDSYRIRLTKAGYAPLVSGAQDPAQPLVFAMTRAAVIRGSVLDVAGDPHVNMLVTLRPSRRTGTAGDAVTQTDDRGEFRFGNLDAGRYELLAVPGGTPSAVVTNAPPELIQRLAEFMEKRSAAVSSVTVNAVAGEESVVTLAHADRAVSMPYAQVGGVITGALVDEFGEPLEQATVRLWATRYLDGRLMTVPAAGPRPVDDQGRFRVFHIPAGRYLVTATPSVGSVSPGATAYLPVYYPGRFEAGAATALQVDPASETAGIDMIVPSSRGARVFGTALSSAGTALDGAVMLVPSRSSGPRATATTSLGTGSFNGALSANPGPDGSFVIDSVPPGDYLLQAVATIQERGTHFVTDTIAGVANRRSVNVSHIEGITEFTTERHTIAEGELGPLTLTTVPTATIKGKVSIDGPGQTLVLGGFAFAAVNVDPDELPALQDVLSPDVPIQPDGSVEISGITGRVMIVLRRAPPGWWLKSVNVGGTNAADTPIRFDSSADSRHDLTFVLAQSGATLTGRVVDAADVNHTVVVFPVERQRWLAGPRQFRTTATGADGSFSLNSFPPGQYYVVAIAEEQADSTGDWENPEQLEALIPLAQRVTLSERETESIELPLRPAPR